MNQKNCAYCGLKRQLTREHIIPATILNLFPECDYTIDRDKGRKYKSEPTIKDVCSECNGDILSILDTYAKELISRISHKSYDPNVKIPFIYNYYLLSRFLLKVAYNYYRTKHKNIINIEGNKPYMLGKVKIPTQKFSIFAGLSINTSPAEDKVIENEKIQWGSDPKFIYPYLMKHEISANGKEEFCRNTNLKEFLINDLESSFRLRVGSVAFLVLFWKANKTYKSIEEDNQVVEIIYPYSYLSEEKENSTTIERVTHAYNYFLPNLIDTRSGLSIVDEISSRYTERLFMDDRKPEC